MNFWSFQEEAGFSDPIVILNIVPSLILTRDEVQLYGLVSDQPTKYQTPL